LIFRLIQNDIACIHEWIDPHATLRKGFTESLHTGDSSKINFGDQPRRSLRLTLISLSDVGA